MFKLKIVAVFFVCGFCLCFVNASWAKDYKVNVTNKLTQQGSFCKPVTLSIHSAQPVVTYSLQSQLNSGETGTFNVTAMHCNRMQLEAKCHWYRPNTPAPGGVWLDTSAAANFDCVSGTATIEIESGQLRVKAP